MGDDGAKPRGLPPNHSGFKFDPEMLAPVSSEVIRRAPKKLSKEDKAKQVDEFVSVDLHDIYPKKPKERLRWLHKAISGVKKNKVKSSQVYDIVAHRNFIKEVDGSVGTDMVALILANISIFSHKQQKWFKSNHFELYRKYAPMTICDSDEEEGEAPPPPEMAAPKLLSRKEEKKRQREAPKKRGDEEDSDEEDSGGKKLKEDSDDEKPEQSLAATISLNQGKIERRLDHDGQAYTLAEFIQEYGGTPEEPPTQWEVTRGTAFWFKE